ncbi:MAG: cytochrome c maturation protein CcmE [Pleurocapsa sp. SU_196_0]|nr:cytochrome c maturation protein CcmE [Pleurocapsa sp. SU_196_0]
MTDTPRKRSSGALKYGVALVLILGAIGLLLSSSLNSNLTFFITPSEYARDTAKYENRTVRLGGVVEPNTKSFDLNTLELRFKISDGSTVYPVYYKGAPPDLMREGIGVTVQGKFQNGVFNGEELLVKHSEEYRAPKPGEQLDYSRLIDAIKDSR